MTTDVAADAGIDAPTDATAATDATDDTTPDAPVDVGEGSSPDVENAVAILTESSITIFNADRSEDPRAIVSIQLEFVPVAFVTDGTSNGVVGNLATAESGRAAIVSIQHDPDTGFTLGVLMALPSCALAVDAVLGPDGELLLACTGEVPAESRYYTYSPAAPSGWGPVPEDTEEFAMSTPVNLLRIEGGAVLALESRRMFWMAIRSGSFTEQTTDLGPGLTWRESDETIITTRTGNQLVSFAGTGEETATWPAADGASAVALVASSDNLFVGYSDGTLESRDGDSGAVLNTGDLGGNLLAMMLEPSAQTLWVVGDGSDVRLVSPVTLEVTEQLAVSGAHRAVAFTP